jgi:hypothetical protein
MQESAVRSGRTSFDQFYPSRRNRQIGGKL